MEKAKKVTKVELYAQLKGIVENAGVENAEELIAFIDKQVEAIENKAAKAKERAAVKKAEGDALRDTVEGILTNEFQTIATITKAIGDEEVTNAKVTARLTQLVNAGVAVKAQVTEGSRKVMGYKLAEATEVADAE